MEYRHEPSLEPSLDLEPDLEPELEPELNLNPELINQAPCRCFNQ